MEIRWAKPPVRITLLSYSQDQGTPVFMAVAFPEVKQPTFDVTLLEFRISGSWFITSHIAVFMEKSN